MKGPGVPSASQLHQQCENFTRITIKNWFPCFQVSEGVSLLLHAILSPFTVISVDWMARRMDGY